MKGDELFELVYSITNLLYETGKKRVIDIAETGICKETYFHDVKQKEMTRKLSVASIIASIGREVSLIKNKAFIKH